MKAKEGSRGIVCLSPSKSVFFLYSVMFMVTLALLQQGGQDGALDNGSCSEIGCILFHERVVTLVCWLKLAVRVVWNPKQLAEESGGNKIISQLRRTQNTDLRKHNTIMSAEMELLWHLPPTKTADSAPVTRGELVRPTV